MVIFNWAVVAVGMIAIAFLENYLSMSGHENLATTDLAILCDEPSNDAKITLLLQFIERNASVVKFNPQYNPR